MAHQLAALTSVAQDATLASTCVEVRLDCCSSVSMHRSLSASQPLLPTDYLPERMITGRTVRFRYELLQLLLAAMFYMAN